VLVAFIIDFWADEIGLAESLFESLLAVKKV